MYQRKPYVGDRRKLVIGMDVGTTFSGVSFCILDPGVNPVIKSVTRFPAQEVVGSDSKIPSILFYDENGIVRAVGAEALEEATLLQAEEEKWRKVEWFKLYFSPRNEASDHVSRALAPLPPNKSPVVILGDYLAYLLKCTKEYIQQTEPSGDALWGGLESQIEYIFTVPNGWRGSELTQIRHAAVLARLIPDGSDGQSRIQFTTEGEASLHFCVQRGLVDAAIKDKHGIFVIDAGGGTIDCSTYRVTSTDDDGRISFEEISTPRCHFRGSVFVTSQAKIYLEEKLRESKFSEDLDHMLRCFDNTTKLRFRNGNEPSYIKFGRPRDNDSSVDIRAGQMKLPGSVVASFFEASITAIKSAALASGFSATAQIKSAYLVGGFAASDWLYSQLNTEMVAAGIQFFRPDTHVNKAVSDGAVGFYLDNCVSLRRSRYHYGTSCSKEYVEDCAEHRMRWSKHGFVGKEGKKRLNQCFDTILPEGTAVSEKGEHRRAYFQVWSHRPVNKIIDECILYYVGEEKCPQYIDKTEDFPLLCQVQCQEDVLNRIAKRRTRSDNGRHYYKASYYIVLSLGKTELRAQIAWKEDGEEKRSPATVVYAHQETVVLADTN